MSAQRSVSSRFSIKAVEKPLWSTPPRHHSGWNGDAHDTRTSRRASKGRQQPLEPLFTEDFPATDVPFPDQPISDALMWSFSIEVDDVCLHMNGIDLTTDHQLVRCN